MKSSTWIVAMATAGLLWAGGSYAGDLTPPGSPGGTMYTLEQIYNVCTQLSQKLDEANARVQALSNRVTQLTQTQLSAVDGPRIVTVDTNTASALMPSLKFSPARRPAISAAVSLGMAETQLAYYEYNGAFWEKQTLETGSLVGLYSSLTFNNPPGYPAISYMAGTGLKYTGWDGTRWITYTVDSGAMRGAYSSLDFNGWLPAIAHYDGNDGDLRFARWNGASWELSIITSTFDSGSYCSFKYNSQGHPCVSFCRRNGAVVNLMYATQPIAGMGWNVSPVDDESGTGIGTSLAFTPEGNPAISYCCETNGTLKYAAHNGATWDIQTVDRTKDAVGNWTNLAFTPQGRPAIVYVGVDSKIRYAEYSGTAWQFKTVDWANNVYGPSFGFTPSGRPAVAYTEGFRTTLNYAELIPFR